MNAKHLIRTSEAQQSQHVRRGRCQQHAASALPGQPLYSQQTAQRTAVHEGHFGQIDDDPQLGRDSSLEYPCGTCGIGYVKLAAQRNHHVTSTCARTHMSVEHPACLLTKQPGGVPTRQLDFTSFCAPRYAARTALSPRRCRGQEPRAKGARTPAQALTPHLRQGRQRPDHNLPADRRLPAYRGLAAV